MEHTVYTVENKGYFRRVFKEIVSPVGTLKWNFLAYLVGCVPVLGIVFTFPYIIQRAVTIAWGIDMPAKKDDLFSKAVIRNGLRAIGVFVVYSMLVSFVALLFDNVGFLGSIVSLILSVFSSVIVVPVLLSAIYKDFMAGFKFKRIFDMLKADTEGILRVIGAIIVFSIICSVVVGIAIGIILVPFFVNILSIIGKAEIDGITLLNIILFQSGFVWVYVYLLGSFGITLTTMFEMYAVAFWFQQFNVSEWGDVNDELPDVLVEGETPSVMVLNEESKVEETSCACEKSEENEQICEESQCEKESICTCDDSKCEEQEEISTEEE